MSGLDWSGFALNPLLLNWVLQYVANFDWEIIAWRYFQSEVTIKHYRSFSKLKNNTNFYLFPTELHHLYQQNLYSLYV